MCRLYKNAASVDFGHCGCDRLKGNGPQRIMCLNVCPMESGTINRCSLVGVGMALLECVTVETDFEILYVQARPSVSISFCCLQIKM